MAKAPSSYIQTTGAARQRTADSVVYTVPFRPQAVTIYLRFVETGGVLIPSGVALLGIGGLSNGIEIYGNGSVYAGNHYARGSTVTATCASAPSVHAMVELVLQLSATGTVTMIQSINGATAVSTAASSALSLAVAWDNNSIIRVGRRANDTGVALVALRDILLVRGVHSLATLRTRIGLTP